MNYTVTVQERDLLLNDTNATVTVVASEVTTELELLVNFMVKAYHEYSVSVTSQTSAGMGEAIMDSFSTPEGGKTLNLIRQLLICIM